MARTAKAAAAPAKPGRHPRMGQVEAGDHVYVQHGSGPMAMRVRACGADGFTGECEAGRRHKVPYDRMLGHKSRVKLAMKVLDAGQEGAIVEDERGRRRFLQGDLTPAPDDTEQSETPMQRDPLTDGLDRLAKALDGGRVLLLKASIKNAPGLALKDVSDKRGHQTKRWVRTAKDMPKARHGARPDMPPSDQPGSAPLQMGDEVKFRHGEVEHSGKIIAAGADGVRVRDAEGVTHQVRHGAITGAGEAGQAKPKGGTSEAKAGPVKHDYAPKKPGQDDRSYFKEHVDSWPDPEELPEDHGRFFNETVGAETIPLDKIALSKPPGDQGARNAPKAMAAAFHGVMGKRDPVEVERLPNGTYRVVDGNGTVAGVKALGWKNIPAVVVNKGKGTDAEAVAASLTTEEDASLPPATAQPVKTEAELFELGKEALDQMKEWLDRDKGIIVQMGHTLMTKPPEDVAPEDWETDEGMLFIAPLKGAKRAREKVAADYEGDWSQLRDVVRCSIAVPTLEGLIAVMGKLRENGLELAQAPRNRFAKPIPVGYRDLLMNVRLPNGMIAEVQLHAKPMLQAKNEGHHWYEVARTIEAQYTIEGRDPTPAELAKIEEAEAKQKEIYGRAWAKISGTGETMAKALRMRGRGGARGQAKGASSDSGGYEHFNLDGAVFRRKAGGHARFVSEVLHGQTWKAYTGSDKLKPAVFGDPVPDPLRKASAADDGPADPKPPTDKPMMKALLHRFIFWRR